MFSLLKNPFIKLLFFGNYFYGICAIALSVEATLQQQIELNPVAYYVMVFSLTVFYYTRAYITDSSGYPSDERNEWYIQHKKLIYWSQNTLLLIAIVSGVQLINAEWNKLQHIQLNEITLLLLFPLTALLYYGILPRFNLRNFGALKPFVIGFCWAGIVTWYPYIFNAIENELPCELDLINYLLFLKNLMFISVLCIMFDIKDYATDAENQLNTFVVRSGLKRTIFFIILPLSLAGLATFIIYGITREFHPIKIAFNVLPFLLMILAAYSLKKRKPLMYYLVFIDGLMLIKGICGSIAMKYFS